MRWIPSHRTLILIASLWWIISFFAETAYCQPYSTPGLYASPILMILGLIRFPFYIHRKTALRRSLLNAWRTDPENLPQPDVRDPNIIIWIILGFWTFCICVFMAIGWLSMSRSRMEKQALAVVKAACISDSTVIQKTGGFRTFGMLVGGTVPSPDDTGSAVLSFTIVGKERNVPAEAELIRQNGQLKLTKLETHRPR